MVGVLGSVNSNPIYLFSFAAVKDVFIVAAKRTPFGTYGGSLANFTAIDLQEVASRAALAAGGVRPELINSVIIGSVFYVSCIVSVII